MVMADLKRISIDKIDRCTDSRRIDPLWVTAIAEGIAEGDVPSPIDVIERGDRYEQIFGQHRLAAADQAGATEIDARVFQPADFVDAHAIKLHQIKENLGQRALSFLDKSIAIAEWADIFNAENSTKNVAGRKVTLDAEEQQSAFRALTFSQAAQEAFQISRRSVFNHLKIARNLDKEVIDKISLTWLANHRNELLELASSRSIGDLSSSGQNVHLKIIDLIFDENSPAQTVADAVSIIENGALLKEKPDPVAKTMDKFSRFNAKQKETFFELNEQDIRAWLAKRDKSRSAS
jgi:ParB family chromosome partitioning protein